MNQFKLKQKLDESKLNDTDYDIKMIEEINKRVANIDLIDETETNENDKDFKSKEIDIFFYTQLYELLRKRKQIPTQEISLQKLDIFDAKYEISEPGVQIPIAETSFLKLQSPKILQQPEVNLALKSRQQPQKLPMQPQPNVQQSKPQIQSFEVFSSVSQPTSIGHQIKLPISSMLNTQLPTDLGNNLVPENVLNLAVTSQKIPLTMPAFGQQQTTQQQQPPMFNFQPQPQHSQLNISASTLQQQKPLANQHTLTITKPQQHIPVQQKPHQPAPFSEQSTTSQQSSTPNLFNSLSANLNTQQSDVQFSLNISDKKSSILNNFAPPGETQINLNTNVQKSLFGQATVASINPPGQNNILSPSHINIIQNLQKNQPDQEQSVNTPKSPAKSNLFGDLTSGPKFSLNLAVSSKLDDPNGVKTNQISLANAKSSNSVQQIKSLNVENQSKQESPQKQISSNKADDQLAIKESSLEVKTTDSSLTTKTTTANTELFSTKIGESKCSYEVGLPASSQFSMLAKTTSNIFGQALAKTETNNSELTPVASGRETSLVQTPNVVEKKTTDTPTVTKSENEEKKSIETTVEKSQEKQEIVPTKTSQTILTNHIVSPAQKMEEKVSNEAAIKANETTSTTTTTTTEQQATPVPTFNQPPALTSLLGQPVQTTAKPLANSLLGSSQPVGSLFSNLKPAGPFQQSGNAQTSIGFSLSQPSTAPNVNPFTAMTNQAPKSQTTNELDADMDSSTNNIASNLAIGIGFGGLGATKSTSEPTKSVFGSSLFGNGAGQSQQPKSIFVSGILKTPTFTAGQPQSTGPSSSVIFGSPNAPGSNSNATNQHNSGGGLFSSFKTPEKPVFGGAPAFGAPPAFGAAPSFGGGSSFGTAGGNSLFGGSSSGSSQSTFGSAPLFGASSTNQQSGFSALATGGTGFSTFGQNTSALTVGFGTLAQQHQQPQQSLFSSFGQNNQSTGFTSPNSSSFTAYRK